MSGKVSIGIDVGGTFTHGVALDAATQELRAQVKVPTTHQAPNGVAEGIFTTLETLLTDGAIQPEQVARIAHSTTQATNALLEGDVAHVGILAAGVGLEGQQVRLQTQIEAVELAPGKYIPISHRYVSLPANPAQEAALIDAALCELIAEGAQSLVAVSAFSVDKPEVENRICQRALALAIPIAATHELTSLYGVKARTRTAVINAAILPKMIHTATQTGLSAEKLGITAPLVVMRSDGGAMALSDMKKRPILTILSGPAAGVAAALMRAKISDGIFLEVGGTSTDISCIHNGHPDTRMAHIGPHRLYLNTLDIRTIGVAGGSLPVVRDRQLVQVGPRSAHIAGFEYAAFPKHPVSDAAAVRLHMEPGSQETYPVVSDPPHTWAYTTTCAANTLGLVPKQDYAQGDLESITTVGTRIAQFLGLNTVAELATRMLDLAVLPISETVNTLISEKKLDQAVVRLIGGGGGASAIVHYTGQKMGYPVDIVDEAPVISAIGAALALLQETIERNSIDPKPADIAQIRQEAETRLITAGAEAATIEVRIEVDKDRGVLRAIATGAHRMTRLAAAMAEPDRLAHAAAILKVPQDQVTAAAEAGNFTAYQAQISTKKWFGLLTDTRKPWAVLDQTGRVRFASQNGRVVPTTADPLPQIIEQEVHRTMGFGDGGAVLPAVFVISPTRASDFSGFETADQILAAATDEQSRLAPDVPVIVIVSY